MKFSDEQMKQLTKAEEQVMQILWDLKKGFVNDVLDQMPNPKPAYNTVSTIVRILEKKGFVSYTAYGKTHEYYPIIERNLYRSYYLKSMITNYFGGSFERLVSFFAKDNDMNIQEMEELLKNVQNEIKDTPNE